MKLRLFAATLPLLLTVPALAQQSAQGNIRTITRYRLDGGNGGDFRAAIKEFNEVLRKAGGERYYSMWSSASGPTEMVRVDYYKTWAELDRGVDPKTKEVAGELRSIASRITSKFNLAERVVDEILPQYSLPQSNDMPKMVRVLRTVIKPGQVAAYNAIIEKELMPAVKKSGLKVYMRSQTRFGGPSTEFRSVIPMNGWGDLDGDGPIVKAMGGRAEYDKFLAKIQAFQVESEYNIYRFEKDLSYLPGASGAPSGGGR